MDFDFSEGKKRHVDQLQLTSMIDIFTLIIVFLMKGTVIGGSSVDFPKDMRAPTSMSKEGLETSPQVVIFNNEVEFKMINLKISIEQLKQGNSVDYQKTMKSLSEYLVGLSGENKNLMSQINILADGQSPYANIFSVVKILRIAGYTSMLFIAHGEEIKK
jgi:biopolymer transport protein ExbD